MRAVICPVCNGNGQVSNGFYSHPGDCPYWVSGGTGTEICRSCDGDGWVEVGEDREVSTSDYVPDNELQWTYTSRQDRCPYCGLSW